MDGETFATPCRPQTLRQVQECVPQDVSGTHAVHRRLTDLVHYVCNCGYSSGWVPVDTMPLASDFIEQHMPDPAFLDREQMMTRMMLGCTCHE